MTWLELMSYLTPYQFSLPIAAGSILLLALYFRGLRAVGRGGQVVGAARRTFFLLGFILCYAVLHTRFDYYAQYLFFMHRLQHLVLHHAGPFLIALSAPWQILWLGLPERLRKAWQRPGWHHRVVQSAYGFIQHPVVAPILFVGLIYFWLTPGIHFTAMLDLKLYHLMNWSMLIDGLFFWWLMLNPRTKGASIVLSYSKRIVILFLIMVPQIILGGYIALSRRELYDVYDVCGRAWPIASGTDQQLGGLLTWIPASMMSVLGILVVIRYMLQHGPRDSNDGSADLEFTALQAGQ